MFIIIPCFIGFVKGPDRMGDFIGLVIGIVLLLCAQGFLAFSVISKLFVPFILIMIGISIIFKDAFSKKITKKIKDLNKSELKEYAATFGENKVDMSGQNFEGADLTAVFGSVDLNLKDSIIENEQVINATAVFGGVQIRLPENVNVKIKSTPIFGGVSNKVGNVNGQNIPTIYINAFCMFGGVDIK